MTQKNILATYLKADWHAELQSKLNQLNKSAMYRPVAAALLTRIIKCAAYEATYGDIYALKQILDAQPEIIHTLLEPDNPLIKTLVGENWAPLIAAGLEYRLSGTYQTHFYRRSFRSRLHPEYYPVADFLFMALFLSRYQITPEEFFKLYFQGSASFKEFEQCATSGLAPIMAVLLDHGNPIIEQGIRRAVYENNGTISHELLLTLFFSKKETSWQMAGDLLLAAQLQEGLRQAITETCSDGRVEALKYIMQLIEEHNLERFSSVVRAFDVWSGLTFSSRRSESGKNALSTGLKFLQTKTKPQPIVEDQPLTTYLQLWALANYEITDAVNEIYNIIEDEKSSLSTICSALTFLYATDQWLSCDYILKLLNLHADNPMVVAHILINEPTYSRQPVILPESAAATQRAYNEFKQYVKIFPNKLTKLKSPFFEGMDVPFGSIRIWSILIACALQSADMDIIEDLAAMVPQMSSDAQYEFVTDILKNVIPQTDERRHIAVEVNTYNKIYKIPFTPILRCIAFEMLSSRSMSVREQVLGVIEKMPSLSEAELIEIEALLALKVSVLRIGALRIIRKNKNSIASAKRLRDSKNIEKIRAANELDPPERDSASTSNSAVVECSDQRNSITVINQIIKADKTNGFTLYDPKCRFKGQNIAELFEPAYLPCAILQRAETKLLDGITKFFQLIYSHAEDPISVSFYSGNKIVTFDEFLGYDRYADAFRKMEMQNPNWTFLEQKVSFFAEHKFTSEELLQGFLLLEAFEFDLNDEFTKMFFGSIPGSVKPDNIRGARFMHYVWMHELLQRPDAAELIQKLYLAIVAGFKPEFWQQDICTLANNKYEDKIADSYTLARFFDIFNQLPITDELLAIHYSFIDDCKMGRSRLSMHAFPVEGLLKAFDAGLISRDLLRKRILTDIVERDIFTAERLRHVQMRSLLQDAVDIELTRGDLPTELSHMLRNVKQVDGIKRFISILKAFGSYKFVRGYGFYSTEKPQILSTFLQASRPLPSEDADLLSTILQDENISETRLIEAAMYAPAWLEIVGKYLKIENFAMAAWYFHAHICESFSAEKESNVARYSTITPEDFNDGAFDFSWFQAARQALGEAMFGRLYAAAKYISSGANHRRSQIYADAASGKLSEAQIEANINTKRNKDYLMAYGLIPGDNFLHRYETLMQFQKTSRQFGAQRQASEKRSVGIALANLARRAGYTNVNRFLWQMEGEKLNDLEVYLSPQIIDGFELQICFDATGKAALQARRDGKISKTIPTPLKQNKIVQAMQVAVKSLQEQNQRARQTFEAAMIGADLFSARELAVLQTNPALLPIIVNLLWTNEEAVGFLSDLPHDFEYVRLAHPVDLLKSGRWSEFQQVAVTKRIQQPFKQIFRELYIVTEDEKLAQKTSNRYAGNQVMPRRAVALLRSRGWVTDMEEGLQRVFHEQNLIAKIYAMADWFSPAEVEPPTIENVCFEDRRTGELVLFDAISPIIFSEVMRDLDLMVSVAHAGGVDPAASHSTVAMRKALIQTMLPLLKLNNVRITDNHVFVKGKFGDYSIHLGSGVVHKQAAAMVAMVPVHAQSRGRIFLPFMDDDPKTAEVISKILFLAEDHKIKDPMILKQIRS